MWVYLAPFSPPSLALQGIADFQDTLLLPLSFLTFVCPAQHLLPSGLCTASLICRDCWTASYLPPSQHAFPTLVFSPYPLHGIADLQELLDLHRRYVRQASEDCLAFGGSPEVQSAVAGALQCLVNFAFRLRGTVRSGAGHRAEETWTQVLRLADTWRPLAAAMSDFEGRVQQLQGLLQHSSSKSALAELTLDYNFYYQKQVDRRAARDQRKAAAAEAKLAKQRAAAAGPPADRQWSPAAAATSPGRQAAAGAAGAAERRAWGAAGGGRKNGA